MELIEWRDEFRTGNPGVDHEHQQLINDINRVYASMGDGPPEEETLRGLGDLFAHISAHFALEEMVMREQLYDAYEPHKEDHEQLLDHIRDIMDAYETGEFSDHREEFGIRLRDWFSDHFSTMDARLHQDIGA